MCNRRIRKHALDVVLCNRDDVADRHRDDCEHYQGTEPRRMDLASNRTSHCDEGKRENKNPDERSKPGRLWTSRHESRDRRRRAFVNVRRPNVERSRRNLEAKTHQHHCCARKEQRRILRSRNSSRNLGNVGGACEPGGGGGRAVGERYTVKEKRG